MVRETLAKSNVKTKKEEELKKNGIRGIKIFETNYSRAGKTILAEHYGDFAQMKTFVSILEGLWNGVVVSGVITICVILARSASALFLA